MNIKEKKIKSIILAAMVVAGFNSVAPASAADDYDDFVLENIIKIENNLVCYSYFNITEYHIRNAPQEGAEELADKISSTGDDFLLRAQVYAATINMKDEALLADMRLYLDGLVAQMDYDYINFSILMEKYTEPCNRLHQNPFDFEGELLDE